jgi:hypothetical protein
MGLQVLAWRDTEQIVEGAENEIDMGIRDPFR